MPAPSTSRSASLVNGPTPRGFRTHVLDRPWRFGVPVQELWDWLNDPRTFTRGQLPPFRVEFLPMEDGRPGGFEPGCLNAHHGPLMSFHGVIGEVRPCEHRDLRYSYGSYALSMRLARPRRLGVLVRGRSRPGVRPSACVSRPIRAPGSGPSGAA